jgi:hypothetical protein
VVLVRQYLTCIDELTSICGILQRKVDMLNKLKDLVDHDEPQVRPVDPDPHDTHEQLESASSRIHWAMEIVDDQQRCCQSLLEDLRLATQAVCSSKRQASY